MDSAEEFATDLEQIFARRNPYPDAHAIIRVRELENQRKGALGMLKVARLYIPDGDTALRHLEAYAARLDGEEGT